MGFWEVPRDIEIGKIEVVDKAGFVVISNPANLALEEGQRLYLKGAGRSSVLRLGYEKVDYKLCADITKGSPKVGDVVVYYHRPGFDDAGWEEPQINPDTIDAEKLDLIEPLPPLF